jgi:cell division septation protein DedD
VRALARLSLLVGLGFAAGLLIGIVTEEPELLAGHLRGEGESIVLAPPEGSADSGVESLAEQGPGAAAEPNVEAESGAEAGKIAATAERAPASLPAVAAPPAEPEGGVWAIQVGAFSDESAATRLADDLRGKGYPVRLLGADGETRRWRVRVQPVPGEAEAREMAGRLKRVERLPTWLLPLDERARR